MENYVQDVVIGRSFYTADNDGPPVLKLQYPSANITAAGRGIVAMEASTRDIVNAATTTVFADPIVFADYIPNPNLPTQDGWEQTNKIYARKVRRLINEPYHGGVPMQLTVNFATYTPVVGQSITLRIHDPYTFDKEQLQMMKFYYIHVMQTGETIGDAILNIVNQINADKRLPVIALPLDSTRVFTTNTANMQYIYLVSADKSYNGDMLQSASYRLEFNFKASLEIGPTQPYPNNTAIPSINTTGWITVPYADDASASIAALSAAFEWNLGNGRYPQVSEHEERCKSYKGPLYPRWQVLPYGGSRIFWKSELGVNYDTIRVYHAGPQLIEAKSERDMPMLTTIYMATDCAAEPVWNLTGTIPVLWDGISNALFPFVYIDGYNLSESNTSPVTLAIVGAPISWGIDGGATPANLPSTCQLDADTTSLFNYLVGYTSGQAISPSTEGLI